MLNVVYWPLFATDLDSIVILPFWAMASDAHDRSWNSHRLGPTSCSGNSFSRKKIHVHCKDLNKPHAERYQSINPPSEHNLCTGIRHVRRPKMQRSRMRRIVLQLDIILHHNVSQHRFQLGGSKETSRANKQLIINDFLWTLERKKCVPCMSTMSKRQKLGRRRDQLMLHTLTIPFAQAGKSKGIKIEGTLVVRLITVYRSSSCDDRGTFWYNRAVRERKVFQHFPSRTHWLIEESEWRGYLNGCGDNTAVDAVETLALLEEAVYLSHLA